MAKKLFKEGVSKSIRFRAVCKDGDFVGMWTSIKEEADEDKKRHQVNHSDHEVMIEFEQTGHIID